MKYNFRFHRGTLAESLKTAQTFDDENRMKDAIIHEYSPFMNITRSDISIGESILPNSQGDWPNWRYVIVRLSDSSKCCVGFVYTMDD